MSCYNTERSEIVQIVDILCPAVSSRGVVSSSSTRGYYQLDFKGLFNGKPIPGPSVNLTVIPDPNKPVSLSVEYDNKAKFPAGGKFPGLCLFPPF